LAGIGSRSETISIPSNCAVREEHTVSGRHLTREVPFPQWVPAEVIEQAKKMNDEEALAALGAWASSILGSVSIEQRRAET
jgi:hypothetical protein